MNNLPETRKKAEVKTLEVSINVPRVGGRQVTRNIFEQIPESDYFELQVNWEDRDSPASDFVTINPCGNYLFLGHIKVSDRTWLIFIDEDNRLCKDLRPKDETEYIKKFLPWLDDWEVRNERISGKTIIKIYIRIDIVYHRICSKQSHLYIQA